jgi:hypothetical protein
VPRRASDRHTNLALLALLLSAVATGLAAFAIGTGWVRWIVVGHGIVGFAIAALARPKARIARRGLRVRPASRTWPSVLLGVLVIVVVVSGLGHSTGLLHSLGPVSAMQVHVAAALTSIPLVLWHVLARPVRPRPIDRSRRQLVRSGALLGASALAYGGLAGLGVATGLPGAGRRFTGSYRTASFDPASLPVTQWLNDRVPSIDPDRWTLAVSGLDGTRSIGSEELASFDEQIEATIDCTGGWCSRQIWHGVSVSAMLPDVDPSGSIEVRSVTGYARRFPASDASRLLIATRLGGRPLTPDHGAPARLVAPGRRGFWWVKWITRIAASETPWWWQPPFPLT